MAVLIRGAKVIDKASPYHLKTVDIFIDKGIVQAIGSKLKNDAATVIEKDNLHISIGWTDLFADYREPGFEHKEEIHSGLAAAAAGGFTSVCTTPNTQPSVSSKSIVQYLLKQAEAQPVQLLPLGAISANVEGKNLAEMLDMQANGALAFSDGWKPIQNANLMLKAFEYVKAFNGSLIQIPLDATLSAGGLMHEGVASTRLGMPGIPSIAETLLLHRDIELLRYTKSKLHVTGISAAESVAMIRAAKAEGLSISCSVTPYHLALNDEILSSYDAAYKVSPPIRTEADRLALIEGLQDGTIDCIASHHRPQEWDAKAKEFEYAAEGMNVQESCFAIARQATEGHVSLERLVDAMSQQANHLFGIAKGNIEEGMQANFTLFNPDISTTQISQHSKSKNNPFIGKALKGKVWGIIRKEAMVLNEQS